MKITKDNTLFFLDWDDTLFPTNWVTRNRINLMLPVSRDQYIVYFQELDRVLSKFLTKVMSLGKVIIVTNALLDWVQISSIVLPNTYHLLKSIEIVSARGLYRKKSNNMMHWKAMAFRSLISREFKNRSLMNVISVGDAEYEYQALISLMFENRNTKKYLKSVKFMKDPTHDLLIDQLEVLNSAVPNIHEKDNHLDLVFDQQSKVNRRMPNFI